MQIRIRSAGRRNILRHETSTAVIKMERKGITSELGGTLDCANSCSARGRSAVDSAEETGMTDFDDKKPDRPMSAEQEARAQLLRSAQLQRIDEYLLSHTSHQWRKVAYVIGQTMKDIHDRFPGIPDIFYALRIKHLAKSGVIEAAGNLDRMRHSEIRLRESK